MKSFLQYKLVKIFLLSFIYFTGLTVEYIILGHRIYPEWLLVNMNIICIFVVSAITILIFHTLKIKPLGFILLNLILVLIISFFTEELIWHYIHHAAWWIGLSNFFIISIYLPTPFILSLFKKNRIFFFNQKQ